MSTHHPLTRTLLAHCEELVLYVQQRFPGRDFARDVIHEVCVQLLCQPPREPIAKPLAYLRRMSLHRAVDWCRQPAWRNASMSSDAEVSEPWHAEDGACMLDFQQQLRILIDIIEALPPRPRQCFLLHRIHGMAHADIAHEIGISRNAVSQHISTAVRQIRKGWEPANHYLAVPHRSASPLAGGKETHARGLRACVATEC
ncbi:sigma-70 family RNA polymerase sigma factor [Alcaligenaceae bacterium SJ-26]|nr:sigma-70 family RNA polymerase sigma factor [Alcaligenaceae bacterium SJ-26]